MGQQLASDIAQFSQRDISNRLTVVDAKNTPAFSMIPKGSQEYANLTMEWPTDKNLDPTHTAIADGTDVAEFENPSGDYAMLSNYQQWFRPKGWQIGLLAQNAQNLPGVPSPKARAVAKKMIQLKRMLEASIGSDLDCKAHSGAIGGVSRGMGSWISSTAQTTNPVDANYRTASGCIDTTTSSSVTELIVQNVMQASYQETGQRKTFTFLCGPNHKKAYRGFTATTSGSTNSASVVRTFTQDATSKKIVFSVDIYEGDFGIAELVPTLWNAFYNTTTTTNTALNNTTQQNISLARCYGIDWDNWEWMGRQAPQSRELTDDGGGPRGFVHAVGGLKCYSPKAEIKFAPTA